VGLVAGRINISREGEETSGPTMGAKRVGAVAAMRDKDYEGGDGGGNDGRIGWGG